MKIRKMWYQMTFAILQCMTVILRKILKFFQSDVNVISRRCIRYDNQAYIHVKQ